jgi:hypothetical protein
METEKRKRLREFCKQVAGLTEEQRVALAARMPIVTCEGHPLSFFNQCMLALQAQRALTVVAGYRQWRKAGRFVKAGEHACGCIWVPMGKRSKPEGTEAGNEGVVSGVTGFVLVSVFDIGQTEAMVEAAA